MNSELKVELFSSESNSVVVAQIKRDMSEEEVKKTAILWSPVMERLILEGLSRPEHAGWSWSKKADYVQGLDGYSFCGVEYDGQIQALMLREGLWSLSKHPKTKGKPIVNICFLATAPWNDRDLVQIPRFKGTGTALILEAVLRSEEMGYRGRIGLHALPQAEAFYRERCHMTDLGIDENDLEKLRYFEFTNTQAEFFVKGGS